MFAPSSKGELQWLPFLDGALEGLGDGFRGLCSFFTDDIVLEATECIDGEDRDERMYDEERDNPELWRLIV